jgi:hypothetical protein
MSRRNTVPSPYFTHAPHRGYAAMSSTMPYPNTSVGSMTLRCWRACNVGAPLHSSRTHPRGGGGSIRRFLPLLVTLFVATSGCGEDDGTGLGRTQRLNIVGVVTSGVTGQPIAGAEVTLRRADVGAGTILRIAVTDAQGRYAVLYTEERCSVRLVMFIAAQGYRTESAGSLGDGLTIQCTDTEQTFNFVLQPAG